MEYLSRLDMAVFHAINGASGNHFVDVVLTTMSSNVLLRTLILAVPYVYFWFKPSATPLQRGLLISGLMSGMVAVVVARACSHLLTFEQRPAFAADAGFHHLSVPWGLDLETWSAFPSDTAALCLALPFALFAISRRTSIVLSLLSLVVFVLPRVYGGVHYPHDILAGMLIALGSVALCRTAAVGSVIGKFMTLTASRPTYFYALAYLTLCEETQMFDGLRFLMHAIYSGLKG